MLNLLGMLISSVQHFILTAMDSWQNLKCPTQGCRMAGGNPSSAMPILLAKMSLLIIEKFYIRRSNWNYV